MKSIYLDYNATSPMRPEVYDAIQPFLKEQFGNPSSFHQMGQKARFALDDSRNKLMSLIGKSEGDLIFTSSATEANNLALLGMAHHKDSFKNQIVISSIEHLSVLRPAEILASKGFEVIWVDPDDKGVVSEESIRNVVSDKTLLVSVMAANNETGVIQPIHGLADWLSSKGIFFHVDAVQVLGRMNYDFTHLNAGSISISSHKTGGPKGVGALWVKDKKKIKPLLVGGHHESNYRAGTENLTSIVGFTKAIEVALESIVNEEVRMKQLKERFESFVLKHIPDVVINGDKGMRLSNTSNLSFLGVDTEASLMFLDGHHIYVSSGSACTSGSVDPSHVLEAMKLDDARLNSAVRFSFGYGTTEEDIQYLLEVLPGWIEQLRS